MDLVLIGFNYPDPGNPGKEIRHEIGQEVDGLPAAVREALLEMRAIEPKPEPEIAERPRPRKKGGE